MGANAVSHLQTQRDSARLFMQVKGSQFDPFRRCQTLQNALTRKNSLAAPEG